MTNKEFILLAKEWKETKDSTVFAKILDAYFAQAWLLFVIQQRAGKTGWTEDEFKAEYNYCVLKAMKNYDCIRTWNTLLHRVIFNHILNHHGSESRKNIAKWKHNNSRAGENYYVTEGRPDVRESINTAEFWDTVWNTLGIPAKEKEEFKAWRASIPKHYKGDRAKAKEWKNKIKSKMGVLQVELDKYKNFITFEEK